MKHTAFGLRAPKDSKQLFYKEKVKKRAPQCQVSYGQRKEKQGEAGWTVHEPKYAKNKHKLLSSGEINRRVAKEHRLLQHKNSSYATRCHCA